MFLRGRIPWYAPSAKISRATSSESSERIRYLILLLGNDRSIGNRPSHRFAIVRILNRSITTRRNRNFGAEDNKWGDSAKWLEPHLHGRCSKFAANSEGQRKQRKG